MNDRFGHSAGNRVLQAFASGLTKINRDYDVTARFGGDEFVLASFMRCRPVATEVASWFAARTSFRPAWASWPDDGLTADDLLAEADRRMYANKNSLRLKRPMPRSTEDVRATVQ